MTFRDASRMMPTADATAQWQRKPSGLTLAREDTTHRLARSVTEREQARRRRRVRNRAAFWAARTSAASGNAQLEAVTGWDRLRADLAYTDRRDPELAGQGWQLVADAMQECVVDLQQLLAGGTNDEPDDEEEEEVDW